MSVRLPSLFSWLHAAGDSEGPGTHRRRGPNRIEAQCGERRLRTPARASASLAGASGSPASLQTSSPAVTRSPGARRTHLLAGAYTHPSTEITLPRAGDHLESEAVQRDPARRVFSFPVSNCSSRLRWQRSESSASSQTTRWSICQRPGRSPAGRPPGVRRPAAEREARVSSVLPPPVIVLPAVGDREPGGSTLRTRASAWATPVFRRPPSDGDRSRPSPSGAERCSWGPVPRSLGQPGWHPAG